MSSSHSSDPNSSWFSSKNLQKLIPGLLLSGALTGAATFLSRIEWFKNNGLSVLTLSIILGMLVGNTFYPRIATHCNRGTTFARQRILRLGVILYGLRLTIQDIAHVGIHGLLIDFLIVSLTFILAYWIGTRWLGMGSRITMLIGSGASICGAAAVLAAEPVVKGEPEEVAVAVATVVVFGTIAMFLYPLFYSLNATWAFIPGGGREFGLYIGSTVHEVAQVIVAARAVGTEAVDIAVITKMVRVMMLAPFLIVLSAWLSRKNTATATSEENGAIKQKIVIPWFAVAFIGMVLFNSLQILPKSVLPIIEQIDAVLLGMAMAALGMATHFSAIRKAGVRPLLLALLIFIWLIVGGAVINRLFL